MPSSAGTTVRRIVTGEYARTVGIVAAATLALLLLREQLQITDIAMLFLAPVVLVASRYRRGAALLATCLSVAAFDFLFVPPYYTFRVGEPAYLLTFVVMFVVALVMSGLTARIREQGEDASRRERNTAALYAMSSELVQAEGQVAVAAIVSRHLGRIAGARVEILLAADADFDGDSPRWPAGGVFDSLSVRMAAGWSYRFGKASGPGTLHEFDSEAVIVPIPGTGQAPLGVAALSLEPEGRAPSPEMLETLELLAARAGHEFERFRPGRRLGVEA